MRWIPLALILCLSCSACGVLLPYAYDAATLDHLSVSMSKDEVLKKLGRPDHIVQEDGRLTVWEYRLYAKHEWFGYLIHCPWHPFCYFPAEPPLPYFVALQNGQVCLWGDPGLVRHLASRICGVDGLSAGPELGAARESDRSQISVIPVFMPPVITTPIQRLAVVPLSRAPGPSIASWLDLTLNFLRAHHPQLVLVEREDLRSILDEVGIRYTGHVDDETMVRVGQFTGADSLLTYRLTVTGNSTTSAASLELRLLNVESGTTLFRQSTTAFAHRPPIGLVPRHAVSPESASNYYAAAGAAAYGFAALMVAFGDDPLGVVPDYGWPGEGVKLLGVLHGSPAYSAGLRRGDRLLSLSEVPLRSWTELRALPALLTVERSGDTFQIVIKQ